MTTNFIFDLLRIALPIFLFFSTLVFAQCPIGDVTLSSQAEVDNFVATYPSCEIISGNLQITGAVNDISSLNYITDIQGSLLIDNTNLTEISNFNNLVSVTNDFYISNNDALISITGFNSIITLNQNFHIEYNDALKLIDGFDAVETADLEFFIFENNALQSVRGFSQLARVEGVFSIDGNPLLTAIPDFNNLISVGWTLQIVNTGLTDISGFNNVTTLGGADVTGGLVIQNNTDLVTVSGFNNLTTILYDLLIRYNDSLESISGLTNLQSIGQFFDVTDNASLMSLDGLESLVTVSNNDYIGTVVFNLFNNPLLSDCNAICSLLSSNGIIGLTNIQNNLIGCNSKGEINTDCTVLVPICTSLSAPLNNATNVRADATISWNTVSNATGYIINTGTTSGGTDIANAIDVGNVLSYNPIANFSRLAQIFVTIIPYNAMGQATGCLEEVFIAEDANSCSNLSSPTHEESGVSVDTNLTWTPSADAVSYTIAIGTTIGSDDILNTVNVGNVTNYTPPFDLPFNTLIHVTITSYDANGDAWVCGEDKFTTGNTITLPCTAMTTPLNNATNVPITTDVSWSAVTGATGYIINLGTSSGATDIANAIDVGNVTTYNPPNDLSENSQIFATIIPYNASGQAINCSEEQFITELFTPDCTYLNTPFNGETSVATDTNLSWNSSSNADGYIISVGTSSGATDIANTIDVGNVTTYNPPIDLPENTQIFVTIIPYNTSGQAINCSEEQFNTDLFTPDCTNLTNPFNGETSVAVSTNLSWNSSPNADGYIISVGTSSEATDIANTIDVGNLTTYNPPIDLPENTQIFVTIIPYNVSGQAINCSEEQFITELFTPDCSNLNNPFNGETSVAVDTNLNWNSSLNADGYIISIGTSSGATDIANTIDVGNVTTYNPPIDLPENTQIFVTIIPYNAAGQTINCSEEQFITELFAPDCTTLNNPFNGETNVAVDTNLSWNSSPNADGYIISIGTTPGGGDIANNIDVGNLTTYQPLNAFAYETIIYTSITPYNDKGLSIDCNYEQFTTENATVSIPLFFTPNNDGVNDAWLIHDPENEIRTIYIFNRFGKLLKNLTSSGDGWDGTYNGNLLPSSDYWFKVVFSDGVTQNGHFTLKR